MKPEDINRAIAEHLGWRCQRHVSDENKAWATMCWIRPGNEEWQQEQIPNYAEDLNAMHEAEKTLTDEDFEQHYGPFLGAAAHARSRRALICATAAQRAEAFVRTIGKWRDA